MKTIADMVAQKPDPYTAAIACMVWRDKQQAQVVFHFSDTSTLAFAITYTLQEQPSNA